MRKQGDKIRKKRKRPHELKERKKRKRTRERKDKIMQRMLTGFAEIITETMEDLKELEKDEIQQK